MTSYPKDGVPPPLRVAMDVGFAARHRFMSTQTSGIGRVTEELVCQFSRREDISTSLVGVCNFDGDLFLSSYFTARYLSNINCNATSGEGQMQSLPAVKSRFGFTAVYPRLAAAYAGVVLSNYPKQTGKNGKTGSLVSSSVVPPAFLRLIVKSLKVLDVRPNFDPEGFDVFFSTYLPLPPRDITGSIPRVIQIFDLIPVLQPEMTTPVQTGEVQRIVTSIDPDQDWIICNAESVREDICRHIAIDPKKVRVVPLAAAEHFVPVTDAEKLSEARRKYGIPQSTFLLSLAAWQPRKNIPHLIQSFFSLLKEHPELDTNLVLVGNRGPESLSIMESVSNSEFVDRLVFTGYIPEQDASALYSAASAFVFPSLLEGFGLPPLEAMQCGTPVVCSNATSLPEVVGDAALLVDPTNTKELSDAMYRLLTEEDLRERLRHKGLERSRVFSWQMYSDGVAECLKQAAQEFRTAASSSTGKSNAHYE